MSRSDPFVRSAEDEEIRHHLEECADALATEGWEPTAARAEAERRFGDRARYRARLARMERTSRIARYWASAWQLTGEGASRGVRTLRREPAFAGGVVLTLALGIGANAAMFSVLDRLLFSPPDHVVHHESVRRLEVLRPVDGVERGIGDLTFPDYQDFEAHTGFAAVAALGLRSEQTFGEGAGTRRAWALQASHTLFPLLGVQPLLGRFYDQAEDRIGAPPVAVLGHGFWTTEMGGDPGALGRSVTVGGRAYTVVGVAPPGFTGVDLAPVDVWLPLEKAGEISFGAEGWRDSRDLHWLKVVARVADGADAGAVEAEATALHRNGYRESIAQGDRGDARVTLDPLIAARGPRASGESMVARWLGGVSLLVLLIASANVANLLLARGSRRRREVGVRVALGADRTGVVLPTIVEALVLALVGGAAALLVAAGAGSLIRSQLLPGVLFTEGALGARTAAFALGAALLAGLFAGLGPALQTTRPAVAGDLAMGAGAMGRRRSRLRIALGVAQAALSVVLLVGAGLFVRSVREVRSLDLGIDVDRLLLAEIEFADGGGVFPMGPQSPGYASRNRIYLDATRRLESLPGVTAVAATNMTFQRSFGPDITVPGLDSLPQLPGGGPYLQEVTPGYFAAVGQRIVRGRDMLESDGPNDARVAVVNEAMARALWPTEEALGRTFLLTQRTPTGAEERQFTIVGVAEDASRGELRDPPFMAFWIPFAQGGSFNLGGVYIRVAGDPGELAQAVQEAMRAADPAIRWVNVRPLRDTLDPQTRSWTLGAALFTAFGILALAVAAIGLYGVLSFDVAQRTRELGIRTALGAAKGRLLGSVLRDALLMAGLGVAIGLVVAGSAAPHLADLLFEVSPLDPAVFAGVATALLAVSAFAALVPAWRATRVDPMQALRSE